MPKTNETPKKSTKRSRTRVLLGAVCGILLLAGFFAFRPRQGVAEKTTFVARRGPLLVSVLEGGNIHALESQVIRCEVEGRDGTKILRIVEEGYQVTEEDVANGKVLVELDSSELRERLLNQETDVQASLANLTEMIKYKEVRENRSLSDLKNGNLQKKFTLMDFKKYLGEEAAETILKQVDISEESVERMIAENQREVTTTITDDTSTLLGGMAAGIGSAGMTPSPVFESAEALLPDIKNYDVDFSIFAEDENEHLLGNGEASQALRKFKDEVLIAEAEYALKKKAYEGAQRLAAEGYLTPNELQEKQITFEKSENAVQTARANLELFKNYDLQKNAEQYLLNYEQALLELARIKSDAMAELADAFSDVEWGKRRYGHERDQLKDLQTQLSNCVIKAERPGLVVYGDGTGRDRWNRKILEGATVWERQAIITIPDMRKMALTVKIHESQVKRISTGLSVNIKVDAEADKALEGVVYKVGLLPDSEDSQFNPDQKVYKTTITVTGNHTWLKPGMTARAEIVVREYDDVLYVPLQAVMPRDQGHACLVQTPAGHELRSVEVLDYNNRYCAIQAGLNPGDAVYLHVPRGVDLDSMGTRPVEDAVSESLQTVTASVSP
jgi:multidrug efflux pump subunit AcrA (membrane-fusion protein)